LTTAALTAGLSALEEKILTRVDGDRDLFLVRLSAMDKAQELFHGDLVRVPTAVDRAVAQLKSLVDERFAIVDQKFAGVAQELEGIVIIRNDKYTSIQMQFKERDDRSAQQTETARVAVETALAAQKELGAEQAKSTALAAQKSETAQTKAIEQISALNQTTTGALRDQLEDVKGRVTRIEAQALGQANQKTETNTSAHLIIAVIAILVAVVSFFSRFLPAG